ncbi:MAG: MAE_28990/MAE_18760 family HEPN-like nuclease [Hyphomicrobiaceae bacterium]
MAMLDGAKSVADAFFDELRATVEIRKSYSDIIVLNAPMLFAAFQHDAKLKERLKEALKFKTTDQSALLRGLFVQSIGVFEEFVRRLVTLVLEERVKGSRKYSELNDQLKNGFISHSGRVLTHYGSGSVNGVRYDFSKLTLSLAGCLSDAQPYSLDPRVFTILMGNCTPDRLAKLFEIIGLPDPFSSALGECSELKNAMGETRKAQVAKMAEERLAKLVALRNDIAHGDLTTSISADEFKEHINFLSALTSALKELCEKPPRDGETPGK